MQAVHHDGVAALGRESERRESRESACDPQRVHKVIQRVSDSDDRARCPVRSGETARVRFEALDTVPPPLSTVPHPFSKSKKRIGRWRVGSESQGRSPHPPTKAPSSSERERERERGRETCDDLPAGVLFRERLSPLYARGRIVGTATSRPLVAFTFFAAFGKRNAASQETRPLAAARSPQSTVAVSAVTPPTVSSWALEHAPRRTSATTACDRPSVRCLGYMCIYREAMKNAKLIQILKFFPKKREQKALL